MKKLIIIALTLFSLCTVQAQKVKKGNDNSQREIEYQLANQKYKEQEYAEAGKIFFNLYKKYNQQHYLNQYVECTIRTGEYDKAEKALKDYIKRNNTAWKPIADLVYVYTLDGKKSEADKIYQVTIDANGTDDYEVKDNNVGFNMILNNRAAVVYHISPRYNVGATFTMSTPLFNNDKVIVNQTKWLIRAFFGLRL